MSDRCAVAADQEVPHVHCPVPGRVGGVRPGLALALLSLLLYKLLCALAVLAVLLLPLPLRLFGALHAVAELPLGVAGSCPEVVELAERDADLRSCVLGLGR